jgi:3-methyl-2-oxobutanoate hydroxymethyltransferase
MARSKVTVADLQSKKDRGERLTRVTAYDYQTALLADRVGFDMILVGDSLGMVVLGYENTLPVTMEEMLHHAKAVSRGAKSCFLLGDMPFMSYQASVEEAVRNAGRFLKEAGMDGVKIEGGQELVPIVEAVVRAGIPVSGHIGLTPQSAVKVSGFKVRGKDVQAARKLIEAAKALEAAGCFLITLEAVPDRLAKLITEQLSIPTMGVGAGPWCDGQSLNVYDVVGLFERFTPKFAKRYANLAVEMEKALTQYKTEVESGAFPTRENFFIMSDEAHAGLIAALREGA